MNIFYNPDFMIYYKNVLKVILFIILNYLIYYSIKIITLKLKSKEYTNTSNKYYFILTISHMILIIILTLLFLGVTKNFIITYFSGATLVIAHSLKDNLNNMVSGIKLSFNNIIQVRDYIEIDENTKGFVDQINLVHTIIYNENNENILIPNGLLYDNKIKIFKSDSKVFFNIKLAIPYRSDYNTIKKKIKKILKRYKNIENGIVDAKFTKNNDVHKEEITVELFDKSSVNINIRICMYIRGRFSVYYKIYEEINKLVIDNNIPIVISQLYVHIKDLPENNKLK
jgi:small-conductance mechanosensitive channel